MKEIRENKTIEYDFRKYYLLYSKGKTVGQIPAVILDLDLVISFENNIVKLYCNGFILAHWDNIDLITVNSFLGD